MEYKKHLSKDKKLKKLIDRVELVELKPQKNIFLKLISSIMSQQLSVKVADVIYNRFMDLYNGKAPTPEAVLQTDVEQLRSIGLSYQKARYIHNIAEFAAHNNITYAYINKMSDEAIIKYLTQIKGVGVWTVEMLLMFGLARPDVFSLGDYGLQVGAKQLYGLDEGNKKAFRAELEKLSKKWIPYRSYAARLLWRYKDQEK